MVRDGGGWGEQLELDLTAAGYHTLISLPLGHNASKAALDYAAVRGRMKPLTINGEEVRACRTPVSPVGDESCRGPWWS